MFVAQCGGLKYNPDDFTMVDGVLTSATQPTDVYTPTYSTGVSATFDETKYASKIGKNTTVYTATVAESVTTWSNGTTTVTEQDMADAGISTISGVVDGSTITITYSVGSEPRTALVGTKFIANHCGGQYFDNGVFAQNDKIITTVGHTASKANYIVANCSLRLDATYFELNDYREISLKD